MGKTLKLVLIFLAIATACCARSVVSYEISSDRLTIYFDETPIADDIKSFYIKATKNDPFRRVIDIKSTFSSAMQEDSKTAPVKIRIAQFSSYTTRVVFSREKMFNISYKIEDKKLIIDIDAIAAIEPIKQKADRFGGYKPIVMIDAGHSGRDAGAIGVGKVEEKDIVLKVALLTEKLLKNMGYEVKMTRDSDKYITLQNRTGEANKIKADIFVSIHANAVPPPSKLEGIETYFLSPAQSDRAKEVAALENGVVENMEKYAKTTVLNFLNRELVVSSNKLAIDIQRSMLFCARESFPQAIDSGVREGPFWVLVGAQMPAVLVEIGYVTNKNEVKRLTNESYQKAIAEGIALGVDSYFLNNWTRR